MAKVSDSILEPLVCNRDQYNASLDEINSRSASAHRQILELAEQSGPAVAIEGLDVILSTRQPATKGLQRAAHTVNRRRRRLLAYRADVGLLRAQAAVSWERYCRYRDYYLESSSAYESTMQYSPFRAPTLDRHLYALRSRLEHDRTRLETQYHEASDLQRHLSNLETDLYEVTTKFMDAALDLAQLTLGGTAPADNTTYEPTLELSAPSTMSSLTRLDPLLAQYYDRAGDVSIMAERMGDLQEQHYHEIATRGLREDQAEVLSIADADFDDNYEREHRILQTELDIAAGEADELRARCEAAGLDISAGLRNTEDSDTDVEDSDLKPSNELIAPTPSGPTHDVEGMLHLLDIKDAAEQVRTASSVLRAPLKPSESDDRTVISVDDWIASVTSSLNVDETNYTGFPGDPRSLPARSRNPSLSTLGTPLARRHSETDLLDEVLHGAGYGASGTSPPKPPDRSSLAI